MRKILIHSSFGVTIPVSMALCAAAANALPGDAWHRMEYCSPSGAEGVHYGTGNCESASASAASLDVEVKGCIDLVETGVAPGGGLYADILLEPDLLVNGPLISLGGVGQGIMVGFDHAGGAWAFRDGPVGVERANLRLPRAQSPRDIVGVQVFAAGERAAPFRGEPEFDPTGDFEVLYYTMVGGVRKLNRTPFEIAGLQFSPDGIPCNIADVGAPVNELDISDVVVFLQRFGQGAPTADYSAPYGMFDVADVVAFLQAFGAGCP
ncbi:MAG: hypothetical protein CMJ31_00170 [Phycisphaerae bacterium]|nr:hypothetical protein [Phycisphaerae bacterium]